MGDPSSYEKVNLPEMPTSFRANTNILYFGLESGSIIIYDVVSKTTLSKFEEFDFPVVQI